jgi:hypothetical protein
MSFATESEWAQVIGERRFDEFRSTLSELVAYASPAEEAALRKRVPSGLGRQAIATPPKIIMRNS